MKVNKNELKRVLKKIGVCVGKLPEQSWISFQNNEGVLKFVATDGKDVVIASIPGDMTETIEFVIDYKELSSVIKLRGSELEFIKDERKLTVKDDNTQLNFAVGDISEFNFTKSEVEEAGIDIKVKDLLKVIDNGSFAREEKEMTRKFMTGAELIIKEGKLTIISTNGKLLSKSSVDIENKEKECKCVISPKAIEAIRTFDTETVNIKTNENMIVFGMNDCEYYIGLLNVEFPDITKFFENKEEGSQYIFDKKEILESLSLLNTINDDVVNVECKENKIKMSSNNIKGSIEDTIVGEKKTGEDFNFAINKRMFESIFRNVQADKIVLKYLGLNTPIEYSDDSNDIGVMMPLRKN